MRQKRIVLINDVTGYSRCSVAVQLPIISAMAIECVFVPTAILSINTYHPGYFFDDYTDKMNDYITTYKNMELEFDGIVTGFLGSAKQIDIVIDFIKYFKHQNTFVLVDPVMGDHGKLYPTYNTKMQEKMRELIPYASIMTPNLTELCALLNLEYPDKIPDFDELFKMCKQLSSQGPKMIVVTGIGIGDEIINFIYEDGKDYQIIKVKRIGADRSGTGDVISGVIAGKYLLCHDFYQSVKEAVGFASKCIDYSQKIGAHNHLGLCFEPFLKEL
ncbi:pyridoxamine kinase [Thomasclavelia saccharogumia]|uniref:pyridoxamine kinase n=1 Tax=Thomasclavelia saccharogumia TaxID=341225 RepID=UPI000479BC32|nr:pyridoxamine kinase [Thomasclavelia saccharogumia]